MLNVKKETIETFKKYIDFIEKFRAKSSGPIWYRGCGGTINSCKRLKFFQKIIQIKVDSSRLCL